MMTLRMVIRLTLLIGVVGGCANQDGPRGGTCELIGGSLVTDGSKVGEIDYRVSGGFSGNGDGTSLLIKSDGTLTRTTQQRGTEQGQLDQPTLDDLAGKARAAQFPTLCTMYPCAGCGDDYIYDVSAQINGLTYMVQASSLAPPLPDRLQALIAALQAIVARPLP